MATRLKASLAAGACCAGLQIFSVACAEVTLDVTPAISAGITYTDNLRLQPDDERISQLAFLVTPEISLSRVSPRMETNLDYRAQGIVYNEEDRGDSVLSFLRFNNNATLVENSLFLDIQSNITQQVLDPSQAIPSSGINDTGNRSEVFTAFATPRWEATLGSFARSILSFRTGIVEYEKPAQRDSKENLWDYTLTGAIGRNSSWLLSYFDSTTDYDSGEEISLASATAQLALGIGAKTSLVLTGGLDDNTFSGPLGSRQIEEDFWLVGLRGTVGNFTEYDISAGERFFGRTYAGSISRKRGNLTGEINYSEDVTSAGPAQLNYQALFDFLSEITGVELPVAQATVYVRKRLQLSGTYQFSASSFKVAVFDENREYIDTLVDDGGDGIRGAAMTYNWTAGARTSFNVDLSWRSFDLRNTNETPEDTRVRVRVSREFGAGYSLDFTVWRSQRGATVAGSSYTENAASLGLSKQF